MKLIYLSYPITGRMGADDYLEGVLSWLRCAKVQGWDFADPARCTRHSHLSINLGIYASDMDLLRRAHGVVAFFTHLSEGRAVEVCEALRRDKPVLALVDPSLNLSRFVLGMLESRPDLVTMVEWKVKTADDVPHTARNVCRHWLGRPWV